MKLNKRQLQKIIKEELRQIREGSTPLDPDFALDWYNDVKTAGFKSVSAAWVTGHIIDALINSMLPTEFSNHLAGAMINDPYSDDLDDYDDGF